MTSLVLVSLVVAAVAVWLLAGRGRRKRDPRLEAFHQEVAAACDAADGAAVDRLLARRADVGLSEDEAAIEIEMLEGLREFLEFRAEAERDGLPVLDTQHRVLGADRCHFWTPAFPPDRVEAGGKLFFTATRLVFLGGGVQATPWNAVAKIGREGCDLVVVVPSRDAIFRFRCNAFGEAMRAQYVAERLLAANRARRAAPSNGPAPV